MSPQIVTLIASVVSAIVTVVSLLLSSRFTLDRERRLIAWRKEVDRLFALEELAGELVEEIGSYDDPEAARDRLVKQLAELGAMGGRMSRYPEVRQATRDLHHLSRLIVS